MDCFENGKRACRFEFVPHGSVLAPEEGKIALDVGNRLCPGVIDHHQPGHEKECSASLVFLYPELVTGHLENTPLEKTTVVTHFNPDFDAVTAAFLVCRLISDGEVPPYSDKIASYVRDIDMGICFHRPGVVDTPYGVFQGICEIIGRRSKEKDWPPERGDVARMRCGFALWEHVLSRMGPGKDPRDGEFFKEDHPFGEALSLVEIDRELYLEDLRACEKIRITLPVKGASKNIGKKMDGFGRQKRDSKECTVDGLFARDPKSLLFRVWARSDVENAPGGKGFAFLAVNYGDERYVISVDPLARVWLKGLGEMLESAETEKRARLDLAREGPNRPGYDSPDPWYDGRNPLHDYTIIDTPHGGTVLDWVEVKNIAAAYGECAGARTWQTDTGGTDRCRD